MKYSADRELSASRRSSAETVQLLFALTAVLIPVFIPELLGWPVALSPLLVLYLLLCRIYPALRRAPTWLRAGRLDLASLVLTGLFTVVCCAALIAWRHAAQPCFSAHVARIPTGPLITVAATGVSFALLNASIEETAFRGLLQMLLQERWGARTALLLQAVLFGLGHYGGVPSGWIGCVMATAYGMGLGIIRLRTRGVGACILSHVFVDFTIYAMLAWNL